MMKINSKKKSLIIMIAVVIYLVTSVGMLFAEAFPVTLAGTRRPQVGESYKLKHSKYIYRNHNKNDGIKNRKELSETAKRYAVKGIKKAKFKKGTIVTCLEVHKKWIRIPSGWLRFRPQDMKREKQ